MYTQIHTVKLCLCLYGTITLVVYIKDNFLILNMETYYKEFNKNIWQVAELLNQKTRWSLTQAILKF